MKTMHTNPVPMLVTDLPSIEAEYIQMINRIHHCPGVDVQVKQSHYLWCWQYPVCQSTSLEVTLKGENADCKLVLGKSDLMNDAGQFLDWHDYKADVACIIFSAVHDELISILEQVLDDQLVVTSVLPILSESDLVTDQHTIANSLRLGFSIRDDQNSCLAQAALDLELSHLEPLSRRSDSSMRCINQFAEKIVTSVPLLIDSFPLSYEELESLSETSLIRLQNGSLLADQTHVVLEVGSQLISAKINSTRGTTDYETNRVISADNTKT